MFKSIKAKARSRIFGNYGYVFISAFLYTSISALVYLIFNYYSTPFKWDVMAEWQQYTCFYLLLILKLIVLPISVAVLYKVYIHSANGNLSFKNVFGIKGLGRVIAVEFIPNVISLIVSASNSRISEFHWIFYLDKPIVTTLSIVSIYISYKLFAAKYYVLADDVSLKEALLRSFKTMNKVLWRYILLNLSFIGWIMLELAVYVVAKFAVFYGSTTNIASVYSPFLDALSFYGFGLSFYVMPYVFFSKIAFVEELIQNKQRKVSPIS